MRTSLKPRYGDDQHTGASPPAKTREIRPSDVSGPSTWCWWFYNVSTNRTVGGLAIHTRVVPASSVRVFNIISAVMYSWEVVIITHCTTKQWRLELGKMSHTPTGSGGLCLLALLLGPQSPQRVQTEPEMPSLLPFPSPLIQPPLSSATFYAKLLLRNRLHE